MQLHSPPYVSKQELRTSLTNCNFIHNWNYNETQKSNRVVGLLLTDCKNHQQNRSHLYVQRHLSEYDEGKLLVFSM
jgi:hypothetical protein